MAHSSSSRSSSSSLVIFLCLLVLLSFTQATVAAGRPVPAADAASDKKQTESAERDGSGINLIQGAVRIVGLPTGISIGGLPTLGGTGNNIIGDLDHSVPAAINSQYIPGADDTFVPNTGYEVPNPFRGNVNP